MDTRHTYTQDTLSGQRGFTLVEMMVATFVFVVVVVAMLDLFALAQRASRTAASMQNLQDSMRFSLNRITDEIRDGSIDYAYYKGHSGVLDTETGITDVLAIRTFDGSPLRFKIGQKDGGDCVDTTVAVTTKRCFNMSDVEDPGYSDNLVWHSLSADGISAEYLHFYITPTTDPFEFNTTTGYYNTNEQPHVRIVLKGSGRVRQTDTRVSMYLQTLITTREYRR